MSQGFVMPEKEAGGAGRGLGRGGQAFFPKKNFFQWKNPTRCAPEQTEAVLVLQLESLIIVELEQTKGMVRVFVEG